MQLKNILENCCTDVGKVRLRNDMKSLEKIFILNQFKIGGGRSGSLRSLRYRIYVKYILYVIFKGTSGGPRHCIWTSDGPLELPYCHALYPPKGIYIKASTGIGIVHLGPTNVPLR